MVTAVAAEVGERASTAGALITVMDDRSLELAVQIDETEIGLVQLGQRVEQHLGALADETFVGEVTTISPVGRIQQNIPIFDVTIALDNPELVLRPGMTAEAEIVVRRSRQHRDGALAGGAERPRPQLHPGRAARRHLRADTGAGDRHRRLQHHPPGRAPARRRGAGPRRGPGRRPAPDRQSAARALPLRGAWAVTPVLRLDQVTKAYGAGDSAFWALKGVSFDIYEGEMVALMGPSGSGKTTLMNIIGILDRQSDGHYLLGGEDVTDLNEKRRAEVRNRTIGFVFQAFHLLPRLSVLENVEVPLTYAGYAPRVRRARALDMLDKVGLSDKTRSRPTQLSGGQKQAGGDRSARWP